MSQKLPDESSNEKVNSLPVEPMSEHDDLPDFDFNEKSANEDIAVKNEDFNVLSKNKETSDSDDEHSNEVNLDTFLIESPAEAESVEALPDLTLDEPKTEDHSADNKESVKSEVLKDENLLSSDVEDHQEESQVEVSDMISEGSPVEETLETSTDSQSQVNEFSENDVLVIETPMGSMTVDKVLVYHEMPRLFTARNDDGSLWIANNLEEEDDSTVFLWALADKDQLDRVLNNESELRSVFTNPASEPLQVVSYYTSKGEDAVSATPITVDELTDDMLPNAGVMLNFSKEEIEEKTELATGLIPVITVDQVEASDSKIEEVESKADSSLNLDSEVKDDLGEYSTSKEEKPKVEETVVNSFSSAPAGVSKKKNKTGKIVALSVIGAAILGAAGYFGLNLYNDSKDTTTVPSAIGSIAMGQEVSEACKDFVNADLNCSAELVPTDIADRGAFISQNLTTGEKVKKNTDIVLKYSAGPAKSEFPNLKNKTVEEATQELYKNNIVISEVKTVDGEGLEKDRVVDSSIKAGAKVDNGSEVVLSVSSGKVKLPDWKDKTREFVEADAKKIGVEVEFKTEESDKPSGIVISQTPGAGEIASSSKIVVTVSKTFESKDIKVPDVIGKTAEEAQLELATSGFRQINTVTVKNSEVTETQVTQVVPGVGKTGKSEENIVIIVSEPSK